MKDDPFVVCPRQLCRLESWGEGKVKRLLGTGAGLIFKGSGFYITDYRSSSYKESAKKESGSATTDGAKGNSKESAGSTGSSGAPAKTPAKSD
jgi:predicted nucleic acid-binding Zn ribbon protein